MAITNQERVGKALELLKAGLAPFVEREMRVAARRASGRIEVKDVLADTRLGGGKRDHALRTWRSQLVIMDRKWTEVFRNTLGQGRAQPRQRAAGRSRIAGRTRSRSPATTPTGRSTRSRGC